MWIRTLEFWVLLKMCELSGPTAEEAFSRPTVLFSAAVYAFCFVVFRHFRFDSLKACLCCVYVDSHKTMSQYIQVCLLPQLLELKIRRLLRGHSTCPSLDHGQP